MTGLLSLAVVDFMLRFDPLTPIAGLFCSDWSDIQRRTTEEERTVASRWDRETDGGLILCKQ